MEFAVFLLTLLCYVLAAYVWWHQGTPLYVIALLSGHLATLLAPIWVLVYGVVYNENFGVRLVLGRQIPQVVLVGGAWFYPLPALLVLYLYQHRWWFPGYVSGLFTYVIFVLYHLLLQALGLRTGAWSYSAVASYSFGLSPALLGAALGALVSLGLLYVLLVTHRYAFTSLLYTLLPSTLLLSLLIHGLLGASLWVPILLGATSLAVTLPPWVATIGTLATVALIAWAIHLGAWGLGRVDRRGGVAMG